MPALHAPIRAGVAGRGPKSARVTEKEQPDPAVEGFLALASARLAPRTVEAYRPDLAHLTAWLGRSPTDPSSDDPAAYVAPLPADGRPSTTGPPPIPACPPLLRARGRTRAPPA